MKIYEVTFNKVKDIKDIFRNSSGGYPVLSQDQEWPVCKLCGEKEVLFLQMDISEDFQLPFIPGSHFLVFMCPVHNEIPSFSFFSTGTALPEKYWEDLYGHCTLILNPPGIKEKILPLEPHLVYSSLELKEKEEEIREAGGDCYGMQGFKVGGIPSWAQTPEYHQCSCGSKMEFLLQIPLDFPFSKSEEAEPQQDSFSDDEFILFLGNEVYFFACTAQCNPLAVWAIVQN